MTTSMVMVYGIGGKNKNQSNGQIEVTKRVLRFKINAQHFTVDEMAEMNCARSVFSAAVFSDTIVVTGGCDKDYRILRSSESYIPQFNEWKMIANPNIPKCYYVLVSCNGFLYNIGGWDGKSRSSSVERLQGLKENWEVVSSMGKGRLGLAAVACNDCIYAMGGRSGSNNDSRLKVVEKYDTATNEWSFVKEMNFIRDGHAACVLNGKIYVVGGFDPDGEVVREIECYDPENNTWSIVGQTTEFVNHSLVAV